MATNIDYINYIGDQIKESGSVTSKKMFGEYIIYCNMKPIFLICDNTLFVKNNEKTNFYFEETMPMGLPYKGAKEHFVIDNIEDKEYMIELARFLEGVTELPKKKKLKALKNSKLKLI